MYDKIKDTENLTGDTMKKEIYLKDAAEDRNNNLNLMKIIAALMVIVSHAFPITGNGEDIVSEWTRGRLNLGSLAVGIFFVTGGYLIAKSSEKKVNAKNYFKARCIRIFPQLMFVTVILALIIGPFLTNMHIADYYKSKTTWKYLLNSVLILQHDLPGVFTENIYGTVVNGPLWTLPVEFCCYIACFAAYKLNFLNKKRFAITIPAGLSVIVVSGLWLNNFWLTVIRAVVLFYIGVGGYVYREKIVLSCTYGWLSTVLFFALLLLRWDILAMYFVFPYMIFYWAFGSKHKWSNIGQKAECSYGVYLWGWPIAQILCMMAGGRMSWFLNAILTSVLAVMMGILNYALVECRILKRKAAGHTVNEKERDGVQDASQIR